jgi:hypothetical protein
MSSITQTSRGQKHRIIWKDNGDENLKKELAREHSEEDLINKEESQL